MRDVLDRAATWAFRVRVTRPACNLNPAELTLALTGVASLPGHDDAAVTSTNERLATDPPYKLIPTLAPIPEPSLALTGSLDFGTVGLTAAGPAKLPDPKTLTLTVSGLAQACGTWNLTMSSTSVDAATGQETGTPAFKLVAIDGQTLAGGGLLLDGKQPAMTFAAGPANAAAPVVHQLSIALVLPDQPALAAYQASLRVSLDAAAPTDGAPSATPTS